MTKSEITLIPIQLWTPANVTPMRTEFTDSDPVGFTRPFKHSQM